MWNMQPVLNQASQRNTDEPWTHRQTMRRGCSGHLHLCQQRSSHHCGLFLQFLGNWQAPRHQSVHMCQKTEEPLCKKRHSWRICSVWKRMGFWPQDKQPWSSTGKWTRWICRQDGQEHSQEGKEKQQWPLPRNTCSTKHPYRTYGFESSTKTAGKTHQDPAAHNGWAPQATAC